MKLELARVERLNLGLSAGAVAASLALETPHFATSLAAGALLAKAGPAAFPKQCSTCGNWACCVSTP